MPVLIHEVLPVIPVARLSADRSRGAIMLLPTGLDVIEEMTVEVRGPVTSVHLASPGKPSMELEPKKEKQGWSVAIKDIKPWRVFALLIE